MKQQLIQLLDKLDRNSFEELCRSSENIVKLEYLKEEDFNKGIYIEKICDYLECFEVKHGLNEQEITKTFVSTLSSFLNNKVVKKSRADAYLNKARQIERTIKKYNVESIIDDLQVLEREFNQYESDLGVVAFTDNFYEAKQAITNRQELIIKIDTLDNYRNLQKVINREVLNDIDNTMENIGLENNVAVQTLVKETAQSLGLYN